MSEIEPSGLGFWLQGAVLWLAMYPFVSATSVPIRNYWLMLLIGVPLAVVARNSGPLGPALQLITLILFVSSLVVIVARKRRAHR